MTYIVLQTTELNCVFHFHQIGSWAALRKRGPRGEQTWNKTLFVNSEIFKASALWANAFYKSICPSVRLSVCLCVCLSVCSLLRYHLTVFLPPLPEVRCPIFLQIRNPWGKVMSRSGLRYEHCCLKTVENRVTKKSFFSPLFSLFFNLRSFLTVFLPPLPEVGYPIFLEIRNPWGKVMERSGLRYEHF